MVGVGVGTASLWVRRERRAALAISGVGVAVLAGTCWHLLATHIDVMLAESSPVRVTLGLVEAGFMIVPPVALVALGHRAAGGMSPASQRTVLQWVLLGAGGVLAVVATITAHRFLLGHALDGSFVQMELLAGAGVGGLLGAAAGWSRAEHAAEATRAANQRDAYQFLNRVLRHHVLNSVQIIDGYAARLDDREDDEVEQVREVVRTRTREITSIVENLQAIAGTFAGESSVKPVDLAAAARAEVDEARHVFDAATIRAELPDAVFVRSNDLLSVVIESVIDNAIRHNDREEPAVHVAVETESRVGRVRVADDGPGMSPAERTRLLDPGDTGDRGTGLYLANRIVTEQGGRLRIEDNEPRGTIVTIELPRADPPGDREV
jgi:signal transduction histidine kinase